MSINKALLIKSFKVTVKGSLPEYNRELVPEITQLADFAAEHGFGLSEDLVKEFCRMPKEEFEESAKELVMLLSGMSMDIMQDARTFYKNFPADPLRLTPEQRFGYQIAYYIFGEIVRDFLPEKEASEAELKPLKSDAKTLKLGTEEDVIALYRRIMASPVSVSDQDRGFLREEFNAENPLILRALPEKMPNKENMTFVAAEMLSAFPKLFTDCCAPLFRTATDVLRLIAVLNGASAALSEDRLTLKPMPRARRRLVFSLLDGCGSVEQDMRRDISRWKLVAHCYHPFEFVKNEKVRLAFDRLYKGELEKSFAGKYEEAVQKKDLEGTLLLLSSRPGEFARRLDAVLSVFPENEAEILDAFAAIPAEKFEPKLLLQLVKHFEVRRGQKEFSIYLPKGGAAGLFAKAEERDPVTAAAAERVKSICEDRIREIYAAKPPLGKVYIDDSIKGYKVPMQQRNSSAAGIRVPAKGSRIPCDPDKDIVRTFIWWTNEKTGLRVDVDLSLNLYDENMNRTGTYFYGNFFRETSAGMVSSGDITDGGPFGGKGAAEYLDFSRKYMQETGTRYVQVCVNVYTQGKFSEFPCKFGYMLRDGVRLSVPFVPSEVEGTIDISTESSNYSPAVFDTETGEFIWVDVNGLGRSASLVNVIGQTAAFNASLYAAVHNEIPELYDLVRLNAEARGEITEIKEEADTVYSLKEGITPYDLDIISADLLAKEVQVKNEGKTEEAEDAGTPAASPEKAEAAEQPSDEDFLRFLIGAVKQAAEA
ncbi:MAG: hypothetical protein IKR59_02900 [Lachnospiraceae bacterium]|nr:hypothetical protein [Lachnospiraceae bacterium]